MHKVAQGWVLRWEPPERAPTGDSPGAISAALAQQGGQQQAAKSVGNYDSSSQQSLGQLSYSVEFKELGNASTPSKAAAKSHQQHQQQQPAQLAAGGQWHQLDGLSRERSKLVQSLRLGASYLFRVYAHAPTGVRGGPSAEYLQQIPENKRKPGGTQALSAGVVSGVLFFIACIVIAVCAVNICNKRRKKRAQKGN